MASAFFRVCVLYFFISCLVVISSARSVKDSYDDSYADADMRLAEMGQKRRSETGMDDAAGMEDTGVDDELKKKSLEPSDIQSDPQSAWLDRWMDDEDRRQNAVLCRLFNDC